MATNRLPGLSVTVIEDGMVTWSEVFGQANLETGEPVTSETMFEAASLSKPVFAYAVLKLAELGRLSLDEPLVETLHPEGYPEHDFIRQITARHVLEHTTGLPNWRDGIDGEMSPRFEPGSEWGYSGEAFFWLQRVVEHRTGEGLDSLMQRLVLEPAGMTRSTFSWTPARARHQVYGHRIHEETGEAFVSAIQLRRELGPRFEEVAARWDKPIPDWTYEDVRRALAEMRPHDNPHLETLTLETIQLPGNVFPNAAGSLACTTQDYARFIQLLFERPRRANWEIPDASRRAMLETAVLKTTPGLTWGLSWGLEDSAYGRVFYHSGNNAGMFRTFIIGDRERRRAIIIFTNGARGHHVVQSIVERITKADFISSAV
jgi:CubicO group peptidase (beta-lactamase class C family)